MKKYVLIVPGTDSSKIVDSFNYNSANIDKIAIDDNDEYFHENLELFARVIFSEDKRISKG